MISKIRDFITQNRYALIWTICYILVVWAILRWLFNFDMFSASNWHTLIHAELRGFPGFVFGILVLSALPLYIATTSIILRTKKPLFTIPLPKILTPVPADKPTTPDTPTTTPPESQPDIATTQQPNPEKSYPAELRDAFLRVRNNMSPIQRSNFDLGNITTNNTNAPTIPTATPPQPIPVANTQPKTTTPPPGTLPLPTDFDTPSDDDGMGMYGDIDFPIDTPTFSEINFDDTPTSADDATPQPTNATDNNTNPVIKYMESHGIKCETQDNIILTPTMAIATHDDPDFWIADIDTWFAAGKQKPSPIATLTKIALDQNLQPVLYLGQTNILDLDTRRAEWESAGIRVITNLDELK